MELRRGIAGLTDEARKNEDAWKRSLARQIKLLEADTLTALLGRLTGGLRESYRLQSATLVLADPEHELRHLLMDQGDGPQRMPGVLFVDSLQVVAPGLGRRGKPWLGPFSRAEHGALFPGPATPRSVALLPLSRRGKIIGSLNLGRD